MNSKQKRRNRRQGIWINDRLDRAMVERFMRTYGTLVRNEKWTIFTIGDDYTESASQRVKWPN